MGKEGAAAYRAGPAGQEHAGPLTAEDRITAYRAFLAAKAQLAPVSGIEIDPGKVHPVLKPHQADAVLWAARGGRRALFESFGLGKTLQQLEVERLILAETGGRGLIVCPLGVRQEFARDAALLGMETTFIRTSAEASRDGVYVTNYESVRDGKLDPRGFDVVSLDEAAILRGFGGTKTFRELMRLYEGSAAFRFVATATPSPNEYIELLSYAAFLDILDVGQGKTRFFKRDSAHADRLTLHPHMEDEFWQWVASWALFLQKPSDLGHPDDGYDLPPLDIRWHEVGSPLAPLPGEGQHKDGQGFMFRDAAFGVQEAAAEKRVNLPARVARAAEIVAAAPEDHFLLWHDLEDERRAIEQAVPEAVSVWGSQDLDERERRIAGFGDGEFRILSTKPVIAGSGCNFQRHCHRAVFTGGGRGLSAGAVRPARPGGGGTVTCAGPLGAIGFYRRRRDARDAPPAPDLLAESGQREASADRAASAEYGRFAPVTGPELPATQWLPDPYGPDRVVFGPPRGDRP